MKAYICVYRRYLPSRSEFGRTLAAASSDVVLAKFLREYYDDDRYYDWGDDPAFFAAQEFFGDVRKASWGVCRRNVRIRLEIGDMVIFFCAKPRRDPEAKGICDYFYIGFGTVAALISRENLWHNRNYKPYRQFYNILARPSRKGLLVQGETFHPYHDDWQKRLEAPYVLFECADPLTHFNVTRPLHVSTFDRVIPEHWFSSDPLVGKLENLLFRERGIERRLRTSPQGYQHVFANLPERVGQRSLPELRKQLADLSIAIERRQ